MRERLRPALLGSGRRWSLLALVLLAASPVGGRLARADGDAEDPWTRAQALRAEGRYAEAVAPLEEALAAAGEPARRAEVSATLAATLVLAGEPYRALQYWESAVDLRGTTEDRLGLAGTLLALARDRAAKAGASWLDVGPYLQDALAVAGDVEGDASVTARRQAILGEAHQLLGETEAALEAWGTLDEALLGPAEFRRLSDLEARALYAANRFEEAARTWEAAGNPHGAATAWAAARRPVETARAYGVVLQADPGNVALLDEALRAARYAGGETELAGVLADLAPEDARGKATVLTARGLLAEGRGATDAARRFFGQAAETDPQAARPRYELGRLILLGAKGDDDRDAAVAQLLAALERAPEDATVQAVLWDLAGRDYQSAWRSPRAMARTLRIQQALAQVPGSGALAWANLGNTLRIAGHPEAALEAYDRAVELDDLDPGIASDRGLALSALGRTEDALAAFQDAVTIDPEHDAAHQNASRVLWLDGRWDAALQHLEQAERAARVGRRDYMRYRFLEDRVYRSRRRPDLR